ncbi:MAG: TonB-dependent receptor domain-containing protein [Spirosomataceae bacterium]
MKFKICILMLCALVANAQKNINIKGNIVDKITQSALSFASVAVLDNDRKIIAGATTNENGQFEFSVKSDKINGFRVNYVGYHTLDTTLVLNQNSSLNFGLTPQTQLLKEITVSAEKATSQVQMDKQIFNAEKLGNTTAGTGLDVLQRLPSVTINAEGKILMRGNAEFLVTVNGKFTNQTAADVLAQLPANTIENIEILTSPSASVDAEGKAGIINITTKKNAANGWGIIANGNLSQFSPQRYGGDITFYDNRNKFNSYLTANYRQYSIGGYREGEIRTIYRDTVTYSASGGERPTTEQVYGIRAGTSYSPNKTTNLSTGLFYGYKQNDRIANLFYNQYQSSRMPLNLFQVFGNETFERKFYNQNLFVRTGKFFTSQTDFSKVFANKSKFSATVIYEYSVLGGPLRNQDNVEPNGKLLLMERSDETSPLNAWRLQADYAVPLDKNLNFETGVQWRTVRHQGDFVFERLNITKNIWEKDPEFNDELDLRQNVSAAYLQFNGKNKNLSYRAGLRAEHTYRTLTHLRGNAPVNLSQLDWFPSAQALYKLPQEQEIKLGYSKRIDRPTTKSLSPFKNHRHSEAIWIGDPNLLPEISHNVELSYNKNWSKSRLVLSAYSTFTNNLIFRTNASYNRIILLTISTNAGNSNATGLEMISEFQPAKWWRIYASGNVYQFSIRNIRISDRNQTQSTNYNLNGNMSFRITPKMNLRWDASYLSRSVTAQGFDTDLFLSNIGLKYNFSKKLSADLIFQNIFDSNVQRITTQSPVFYSSTEYTKSDRILLLNLSYRFNESGKSSKNIKTEYGEKDF